jgi:hypothetical protein
MEFSIVATGDWKFLRVRDNIADNDKNAFDGNATNAQKVPFETAGGNSGNISVWARSASGSADEKPVEKRPVHEGESVEVNYPPS